MPQLCMSACEAIASLPSIAYFYTSIEAQRNLSSTRGTHLLQQNPNPQLIQRPITQCQQCKALPELLAAQRRTPTSYKAATKTSPPQMLYFHRVVQPCKQEQC